MWLSELSHYCHLFPFQIKILILSLHFFCFRLDGLHDNENDDDSPIEVVLNGSPSKGNGYNALNTSSDKNNEKKKKTVGGNARSRRNRIESDRLESSSGTGKFDFPAVAYTLWNTITFSWIRPLMVIGEYVI